MKKVLVFLALLLTLCSAAYAAEAEPICIAVIDSGISPNIVSENSILPGQDYSGLYGTTDVYGHGTSVAQFIVGTKNGWVRPTCPSAKLAPLVNGHLLETTYTTMWYNSIHASTAQTIYDAVDVYGCKIINCSFAGGYSQKDLEAIEYARQKGVIVVAGAGNYGTEDLFYPGAYDSVLCVGACELDGTIASFSQRHDKVDLLARGTNMPTILLDGTLKLSNGTSLSTPIVSGALAQIWTENPELTADQVCQRLLDSCRIIDGRRVLDTAVTLGTANRGEGALLLDPAVAEASLVGFGDVTATAYYTDAVKWAVDMGITSGTGAKKFSPDLDCTTAQILTFLWRANGSPEPTIANPFTDVAEDAYYADAAVWAYENGLVSGRSFGGDTPCTRSATVTYLWKLAGKPDAGTAAFEDVKGDTEYAKAVSWAVQEEITSGTSATRFSPDLVCSRGQIVTFLYRAMA